MREFLGFVALGRVELHLEAQARVWSAPFTVSALALVGVPQVLELGQFEALRLEPVDVGQDAALSRAPLTVTPAARR